MAWYSNLIPAIRNTPTIQGQLTQLIGMSGSNSDCPVLSPAQALEVSAVFACVKLIAQRVSATPFDLMVTESAGSRHYKKEESNHWAVNLLSQPNPHQGSAVFLETIMVSALLGDGALVLKVKDKRGIVKELWPVPIGHYDQTITPDGLRQFTVHSNGGSVTYNADDVIFIHGPGFNGYSGISPVAAARQVLGIANSLGRYQKANADSLGQARGIISTEHDLKDEAAKADMTAAIAQRYAAGGSGLMLLSGNTTFTSLSENMNNSQFIQQKDMITREIGNIFGIPASYLLGTAKTEQDINSLDQDAVRPWIIRIEQALNRDLLKNDKRYKFDADEFAHMRSDPMKQGQFILNLMGAGGHQPILTVNEARKMLNLTRSDDPEHDKIAKGGYAESGKPAVATPKEPEQPQETIEE